MKFLHCTECFVGCWLQTPRWYKYRKSVEPYLCLFSFLRYRKDLASKNKQLTPTPEYECHQTEPSRRMLCRRDSHIPKGVYCLLVLRWRKFPVFRKPKQALINAFYNMSSCFMSGSDGISFFIQF